MRTQPWLLFFDYIKYSPFISHKNSSQFLFYKTMRDTIKKLNKRVLAEDLDISYARLRKFAAGEIKELNEKEVKLIHDYLIQLANIFVIKEIE